MPIKLLSLHSPNAVHKYLESSYIPTCFGGGHHHRRQGRQLHGPKTKLFLGCLCCQAHTRLLRSPFNRELVHVTLPMYCTYGVSIFELFHAHGVG